MAGRRPGESLNRGRPPGTTARRVLLWDFKAAVREQCPRALERVVECLDDADKKVRLAAAELLLAYGHGKPQVSAEVNVNHQFVVAPQVMEQSEWLARRGQPVGTGEDWLARQRGTGVPTKNAPSTAPERVAGHPAGPATIDLTAEDALLLDKDPTCPPPAGSKLN